MTTIRVGVLGAASILQDALTTPAALVPGIKVSAIAARDMDRAAAAALRHRIPVVHGSYDDLLADPSIDAVYIPLPASLHAQWTTNALDAGKHVLCEKPFTSNAAAAEAVATRARTSPLVVMEAYHSHYHPLYGRLREILATGEIGRPVRAQAHFCIPIKPGRDIRWNLALGGGSLLDVGYYPVRALTELLGTPTSVSSARAWMREGVDRRLDATMTFPDGVEGGIVSSIWSRKLLAMSLEVRGTTGTLRVSFPYHPHMGTRIRIRGSSGRRVERTDRRTTYWHQLIAFRDAVRSSSVPETDASAAAAHVRLLESIYDAAGVPPRP